MKLTIPKNVLVEALNQVKGATGKTTLPILSCVLLRLDNSELSLTCSDLDLTVRVVVPVVSKSSGAACVRVALLHGIVNALPKSDGDISLEQVEDKLRITSATGVYDLGVLEAGEFPPLAKVKGKEFTLEQMPLVQMLFSTADAMSDDEGRYILNGVNLTMAGGAWTAVATDGRRLHRVILGDTQPAAVKKSKKSKAPAAELDLIIPRKTVKQLLRLLPVADVAQLTLKASASAVEFEAGGLLVQSKLVEGSFPNWQQVVPAAGHAVPVQRSELAEAAARVALIDEHCVISLAKGFSKITAASKGNVDTGQERLGILESEPFTIKLQVKYLLSALGSVAEAEIGMCYLNATSPLVLKTTALDWLAVIMPMRMDQPPTSFEKEQPQSGPTEEVTEARPPEAEAPAQPEPDVEVEANGDFKDGKLTAKGKRKIAAAAEKRWAKVKAKVVTDEEVQSARDQAEMKNLRAKIKANSSAVQDENETRIQQAIKAISDEGKCSVSLIQRWMNLSYSQANDVLDELQQRGIVGKTIKTGKGAGTQPILITLKD